MDDKRIELNCFDGLMRFIAESFDFTNLRLIVDRCLSLKFRPLIFLPHNLLRMCGLSDRDIGAVDPPNSGDLANSEEHDENNNDSTNLSTLRNWIKQKFIYPIPRGHFDDIYLISAAVMSHGVHRLVCILCHASGHTSR